MSDFDREAERERLREKYERDQEKRESTERMSELLLKGATMTDAHCGDCGDPIFRYEGEEFCPTCQERVAADAGGEEAVDDQSGADAAPAARGDDADAGSGADAGSDADAAADAEAVGPADAPDADATEADAASARPGDGTESNQPAGTADRDANGAGASPSRGAGNERARSSRTGQSAPSRSTPEPAGDLGDEVADARASLTRTLLAQARRAENCEDPRRAKDHLAAAREAAEALAALSY